MTYKYKSVFKIEITAQSGRQQSARGLLVGGIYFRIWMSFSGMHYLGIGFSVSGLGSGKA
jgi:hypothetical protein